MNQAADRATYSAVLDEYCCRSRFTRWVKPGTVERDSRWAKDERVNIHKVGGSGACSLGKVLKLSSSSGWNCIRHFANVMFL